MEFACMIFLSYGALLLSTDQRDRALATARKRENKYSTYLNTKIKLL